jgi:hypothetical protein
MWYSRVLKECVQSTWMDLLKAERQRETAYLWLTILILITSYEHMLWDFWRYTSLILVQNTPAPVLVALLGGWR